MNPPWSIICRCLAEYLPALEDSLNGLVSCVVVLQFFVQFSCQCHACKIYHGSWGLQNVNWLFGSVALNLCLCCDYV